MSVTPPQVKLHEAITYNLNDNIRDANLKGVLCRLVAVVSAVALLAIFTFVSIMYLGLMATPPVWTLLTGLLVGLAAYKGLDFWSKGGSEFTESASLSKIAEQLKKIDFWGKDEIKAYFTQNNLDIDNLGEGVLDALKQIEVKPKKDATADFAADLTAKLEAKRVANADLATVLEVYSEVDLTEALAADLREKITTKQEVDANLVTRLKTELVAKHAAEVEANPEANLAPNLAAKHAAELALVTELEVNLESELTLDEAAEIATNMAVPLQIDLSAELEAKRAADQQVNLAGTLATKYATKLKADQQATLAANQVVEYAGKRAEYLPVKHAADLEDAPYRALLPIIAREQVLAAAFADYKEISDAHFKEIVNKRVRDIPELQSRYMSIALESRLNAVHTQLGRTSSLQNLQRPAEHATPKGKILIKTLEQRLIDYIAIPGLLVPRPAVFFAPENPARTVTFDEAYVTEPKDLRARLYV